MDDFGGRVRRLRESLGLTQRAVAIAALVGQDQPTSTAQSLSNHLSKIERGDEDNPSLELVERIARGLGLSLSAFFLRIEELDKPIILGLKPDRLIAKTVQRGERSSRDFVPTPTSEREETRVALALIDIATKRLEQIEQRAAAGPAPAGRPTPHFKSRPPARQTAPRKTSERKTGTRNR